MIQTDIIFFPILVTNIVNFLNHNQREEIINFSKNINLKKQDSLDGDALSSHYLEDDILNRITSLKNCDDIFANLEKHIKNYTDKIGCGKCKITNSWINIQKKDSRLLKHTHPDSIISGVIYLNTDEKSSKLYFYNPNQIISWTRRELNTCYNNEYQYIVPKNGDLFLFPSWLSHGSHIDINNTDERMALSFNTSYN
jgi:uncharacterized protein (TIGR02466 family)